MVSPINNSTALAEYNAEISPISEVDTRIDNIAKRVQGIANLFNMLALKIQSIGAVISKSIHQFALAVGVKIQILVTFSKFVEQKA